MRPIKTLSAENSPALRLRCTSHGLPFAYICLDKECASKVYCERCANQNHRTHLDSIQNIAELFKNIPYQRKSNSDLLLSQTKAVINDKERIILDMSSAYTDAENKILEYFDDLKTKINFLLDLAFRQHCKGLREINHTALNDIENKIEKMDLVLKVHELVTKKKTIDSIQSEFELLDIAKYAHKKHTELAHLDDTLKTKLLKIRDVLQDHGTKIKQFDQAKFQETTNSICSFIKTTFDLRESFPESQIDPYMSYNTDDTEGTKKDSFTGHEGDICAIGILNKQSIATGGRDSIIKLWDLTSGDCVGELHGHTDVVWSVISAYDGKYIVSGSGDKTIKIWKPAEKTCKKTFRAHEKAVLCLAYLKVQKILASGSQDGSIILWDMQHGKVSKTLLEHKKAVWCLSSLKNGYLVSAGDDCLIKIWDVKLGYSLKTIPGHQDTVFSVIAFNDDHNLVSCSADGTLRIWDVEQESCVQLIKAHKKGVRAVAVNSNETLIATGGYDQCLNVWDLRTLKLLKSQENNDNVIRSAQFYDEYSVLYADKNPKFFKLNVV